MRPLWLACVAAGVNGMTVPAAKRDAVGKAAKQRTTARKVAAETQTTRPVLISIRPAVVTERLSSASPTEGFSTPLLFTIEANYTAVPGEDMRNVSALMLDDFKSQFLEIIETGTLQERLDTSDVLALAVVDVDASLVLRLRR
jgi:hypothetical protein